MKDKSSEIIEKLSPFSTDQLLQEIVRRRNIVPRKDPYKIKFCDSCVHARFWDKQSDPPRNFNVCSKGHELSFHMPEPWESPDAPYGFYRRVCADRSDKE